jgi:hypothetical protein
MFKLIWAAVIGGGPAEWAALGLSATLVLGGAFGAGFYACSHMQAKAVAKAVVAQEKHDVKQHQVATKVSEKITGQDKKQAARIIYITKTIHDIEPQNNCALDPDVAKLLNEAGHAPE